MNTFKAIVKKACSQPGFLVTVVILVLAAISLNASTQFLKLYFKKLPVPLARQLDTIPLQLGNWYQISIDQPLERDIEETLATNKYIFRDYVDVRAVGLAKIKEMQAMSVTDRKKALSEIESQNCRAVMHLAVTYYTGMVDTVAHIPDRCYIADGYVPREYEIVTWNANPPIEVRFINFDDATGYSSQVTRNVAYFFNVNGYFESDPLAVRRRLQNLFNKHGFYAKVELMNLVKNRAEAAQVMTDFIKDSLPEIQKCLPKSADTDTQG